MTHAICELMIAAEIAEINAPIHESEGRAEQAALNRQRAESCREAIRRLEAE